MNHTPGFARELDVSQSLDVIIKQLEKLKQLFVTHTHTGPDGEPNIPAKIALDADE